MKFGEFIKLNADPLFKGQYISYNKLTGVIENASTSESSMVEAIFNEANRVDAFVRGQVVLIVNRLRYLDDHDDPQLAENISYDIVNVSKFVDLNLEGFRKLLKKYRKKTGFSTVWLVLLLLPRPQLANDLSC